MERKTAGDKSTTIGEQSTLPTPPSSFEQSSPSSINGTTLTSHNNNNNNNNDSPDRNSNTKISTNMNTNSNMNNKGKAKPSNTISPRLQHRRHHTTNLFDLKPPAPPVISTSDFDLRSHRTTRSLGEYPSSNNNPTKAINHNNPVSSQIEQHTQRSLTSPPPMPVPETIEFQIEEGTPADRAIRAAAHVPVSKISKAARKVHIQALRRALKGKLSLHPKFGNRRGKPPRLPNRRWSDSDILVDNVSLNVMLGDLPLNESDDEQQDPDDSTLGNSTRCMPLTTCYSNNQVLATSQGDEFSEQDEFLIDSKNNKPATVKLVDASGNFREVLMNSQNSSSSKKKNKKKKSEKNKSYVKGKVIDNEHELYNMSIAMMIGLKTSIWTTNDIIKSEYTTANTTAYSNGTGSSNHSQPFWLETEDFMRVEKYIFPPSGSNKTPPHQLGHTFKFKDYSPIAFSFIRRMFGVNEYEFLQSVCGNSNFIEFISNAKSGQFFFYSNDGKYMIKTMTNAESFFLRRILPHYFRHCAANMNTFLTKFLGMYRVKLYHLRRNVKFIIMNSVFDTDKTIQSFFDLKGSSFGRDAKPGQDVKKDNDMRKGYPDTALILPPDVREKTRKQLERDCDFLQRMGIMDYSLLVGVHHIPSKVDGKNPGPIKGLNFRPYTASNNNTINRPARMVERSVSTPTNTFRSFGGDDPSDLLLRSSIPLSMTSPFSYHKNVTFKTTLAETRQFSNPSIIEECDSFRSLSPSRGSTISATSEFNDESLLSSDSKLQELELKERKDRCAEEIYWPFHRFYEMNGDRRLEPLRRNYEDVECSPSPTNSYMVDIPEFELPISVRKDHGLVMDTSGMTLPMKVDVKGRVLSCDGKIYYFGIIDVLQQFNLRKQLEAKWRRMRGGGWERYSCVKPNLYAKRFMSFFEEFTQYQPAPVEDGEIEEVVFEPLISKPKVD